MINLFPNHVIDLKKGTVYSKKYKHFIGSYNDGYYECRVKDIYGTMYTKIHQIIFAYGAQFPKHLWPIDEKGKKYEVDHILPVRNDGTDVFENLRLVSKKKNCNNEFTLENMSKAGKNKTLSSSHKEKLSISQKNAWKEGKRSISAIENFINGGKKYNEQQKNKIYQFSLDGDLVAVYSGRNEAARITGYNRERISFHCKNGKPYKGFLWSFNESMQH